MHKETDTMRTKTETFHQVDENNFSIVAELVANDEIDIRTEDVFDEITICLTKQQAAAFARQLLEMCEVE